MGIKWSDPATFGAPFVKKLQEALWYIDGHHETIREKAPRIPEVFARFTGYYKSFSEVYGHVTREDYRPSLQASKKASKQTVGFTPSQQHVRNVNLLLQCEECDMWRLLFSRYKLNYQESQELERCLDDISYTCGVSLADLDLPGRLKDVCVKDHKCHDPIKKLYYSCEFETICCNCASDQVADDMVYLPQCEECHEQGIPRIKRPSTKK